MKPSRDIDMYSTVEDIKTPASHLPPVRCCAPHGPSDNVHPMEAQGDRNSSLGMKVLSALVIIGFLAGGVGAIKTYIDQSAQSEELEGARCRDGREGGIDDRDHRSQRCDLHQAHRFLRSARPRDTRVRRSQ